MLAETLSEGGWPFLLAERIEDASLPTVLGYGHGDVIRGLDEWLGGGLSPWQLTDRDGRWYGRGVADNKGQHSINIGALRAVIETRGRLGFNAKYLIEMGEEMGSPACASCREHRELLRADVLIASDGPRLSAAAADPFLGSRGCITLRHVDRGARRRPSFRQLGRPALRSGNTARPCDRGHRRADGQILVPEWRPARHPRRMSGASLADCESETGAGGPTIDPEWGEPGLTPAEKVFGWYSFTVLAFEAGNPKTPVNAIPPRAWARCQLRFVVGIDERRRRAGAAPASRPAGFPIVGVAPSGDEDLPRQPARSRPSLGRWAATRSRARPGKTPAILPNLGGSLPNDIFSEISACRPSGCPIPIRPAPSTHRTSICRWRSPAKASPSWLASTGTWASRTCLNLPLQPDRSSDPSRRRAAGGPIW